MGKKSKNRQAVGTPDTYIEADPSEASAEAATAGPVIPESALGKKLASAGMIPIIQAAMTTLPNSMLFENFSFVCFHIMRMIPFASWLKGSSRRQESEGQGSSGAIEVDVPAAQPR